MISDVAPAPRQTVRDHFDLVWVAFIAASYLVGIFVLFWFGVDQTYGIIEHLDTIYALSTVNQSCAILAAVAGLLMVGVLDGWLTTLVAKGGKTPPALAGAVAALALAVVLAALFTGMTFAAFWAAGVGADANAAWSGGADVWIGFATDLLLVFIFLQFLQALTRRWLISVGIFILYAAAVIAAGSQTDVKLFGFGSTQNLLLTFATRHAIGLEAAWLYRLYWALIAAAMLCLLAGFDERTKSILWSLRHGERRRWKTALALLSALAAGCAAIMVGTHLRAGQAAVEHAYEERISSQAFADSGLRATGVSANVDLTVRPDGGGIGIDGRILLRNDSGSPLSTLLFEKAPVLRIVAARLSGNVGSSIDLDSRFIVVRPSRPLLPGETTTLLYRGVVAPVNRLDLLARSVAMPDAFILTTAMFLPMPRKGTCVFGAANRCVGENYLLSDPLRGTVSLRAPPGVQIASAGLSDVEYQGAQWRANIPSASMANLLVAGGRFRTAVVRDAASGFTSTTYAAAYSVVNPRCVAGYAQEELAAYSRLWRPLPQSTFQVIEMPSYWGQTLALHAGVAMSERYLRSGSPSDCLSVSTRMVLSHELAHQWWGYWIVPAKKPGSALVLESFAQIAALERLEQRHILTRKQIMKLMEELTAASEPAERGQPPLRSIVKADERAYYAGPMALLKAERGEWRVLDTFALVLREGTPHTPDFADPADVIDRFIRAAPAETRPAIRAGLE